MWPPREPPQERSSLLVTVRGALCWPGSGAAVSATGSDREPLLSEPFPDPEDGARGPVVTGHG